MIEKDKILESWIMVEHLSEGDISLKDKNILTMNDLQGQDFYSLFLYEIMENQRIIAGNAQFTGIAAGRGVGFTTGLLLLREGLGMRETPIRPHSWH